MFVGHYGVSLAAKRGDRSIPLWVLFLAVQLLDVFWSLFVLIGIEKVRIVPGITASNPLDLYYMPYTHSLVAALLWSLAAYVAYRAIRAFGASHRAALLVALAVFSRSEEHTSELQSRLHLVCRLLLEKKKIRPCARSIPGDSRAYDRPYTERIHRHAPPSHRP